MSAQGLNGSSYSGFQYVPPAGTTGAGIPSGFPTRDASDYTKRLKQQLLYREYAGSAVTTGSTTPYDYTIVQSNANRLSYQFGLIGCTGCTGPFPTVSLGESDER